MAQQSVSADQEAWDRVARAVVERRHELGLTQEQLGVSKAVASALENGRQEAFTVATLIKVARSLKWSSMSITRILHGEEPVDVAHRLPIEVDISELTTSAAHHPSGLYIEPSDAGPLLASVFRASVGPDGKPMLLDGRLREIEDRLAEIESYLGAISKGDFGMAASSGDPNVKPGGKPPQTFDPDEPDYPTE